MRTEPTSTSSTASEQPTPGPTTRSIDSTPAGSDMVVSWSSKQTANELSIHYTLTSRSNADLWVLDRLWKLSSNATSADPEAVYRFERDGKLRLLLGAAPLPRRSTVTFRVVPYARRLPAQGTLEGDLTVSLPVPEYSVYFTSPRGDEHPSYESKHVERVALLVQYIVAGPDIRTEEVKSFPGALKVPASALVDARMATAELPLSLDVQRRTDTFDRVTLPGEAPETLR